MVVVANLRRGRAGHRLIALRSNERAAAAIGIDVRGAKLYAFAIGAGIAAVGGILAGFDAGYAVTISNFDAYTSILYVAFAVVGGIGYVIGPLFASQLVAGGVGAYVAQLVVPGLQNYLNLIAGLMLVVILIQDPDGRPYLKIEVMDTASPIGSVAGADRVSRRSLFTRLRQPRRELLGRRR